MKCAVQRQRRLTRVSAKLSYKQSISQRLGSLLPVHSTPTKASGVRGGITQINEKLWEGRYSPIWPDGKKRPRNVYEHSKEEYEKLLAKMIAEIKTEIASERERLKAG